MKLNKRAWAFSMFVATVIIFIVVVFFIMIYTWTPSFKDVEIDISDGKAVPYFETVEEQRVLNAFFVDSYLFKRENIFDFSDYFLVNNRFKDYDKLTNEEGVYDLMMENNAIPIESCIKALMALDLEKKYSSIYFLESNFKLKKVWLELCADRRDIK